MRLKRVMIGAPKSGSGKTLVTCALLQALKNQGKKVISYKCGPDYIDPMFHETVLRIPSKNLDTFFCTEEDTKGLFLEGRTGNEFAVIEGVMGLFDGLGGIREEGSSYHLAKVTKTPIILVVDAKGMGRSLLALISGFLNYDTEHLIKGVILNRMSKSYYHIMKPLIEEELKIKVVGYFPEQKENSVGSRHLGLVMPEEISDIRKKLEQLSKTFETTVSLEQIEEIGAHAENLSYDSKDLPDMSRETKENKPVIGVAKDEAFCFYYRDNLKLLESFGARMVFFSPLHDKEIPKECDGLLFGGGYPELYAKKLSDNRRMRASVKRAAAGGMPIVAECGGFMYLHSSLIDPEGVAYPMADVVEGECFYTGKLVRFGYVELREKKSNFLSANAKIKGHEFHYYDSTQNGMDCIGRKPVSGQEYACILAKENQWLGFPHLYYPSNPGFAKAFVDKVRKYKKR